MYFNFNLPLSYPLRMQCAIVNISGSRHKPKDEDVEGFQPAMMSFKAFMQTQVGIDFERWLSLASLHR